MVSCSIAIRGISGEKWLMDIYHTCRQTTNRNNAGEVHFTLELLKVGYTLSSKAKSKVTISRNKEVSSLKLTYDYSEDPKVLVPKLKNSPINLSENIQHVTMDWDKHKIQAAQFIDSLLRTTRVHIKSISIISSQLNKYANTQPNLSSRGKHIGQFNFTGTYINAHVLSVLSIEFPELEYLGLNACKFSSNSNNDAKTADPYDINININMPDTAINSLCIINGNNEMITGSMILVAIQSNNTSTAKHYMNLTADEPVEEISQSRFNFFKSKMEI